MPKTLNLRSRILLAALLAAALLQGAVPLANERVRRLGDLLQCKCGCNASITGCNMINCHFSDPVRHQLLEMVSQGRTDSEIYAEMVRIYGQDILLKPPAQGFYLLSWLMPFAGLGGGLALVYFLLRRWRRGGPPTPEPESEELARYRARIEKELSGME